ncbi:MAG TPA: hypothetical protein VKS21_02020, partial [Spirochaetota bacterium]|nr:hypothetical protein [Spirochaetota bacterium]
EVGEYKDQCITAVHKLLRSFTDIIATGISDHTIREDIEPLKTSTTVAAIVQGIIQMSPSTQDFISNELGISYKDILYNTFKIILRGLKPHKGQYNNDN